MKTICMILLQELKKHFPGLPMAVRVGSVLDMGDPVKIMDLAENLIRLSGFVPGEDIDIEVTGLRKGEKLFEELLLDSNGLEATLHEKIFLEKPPGSSAFRKTKVLLLFSLSTPYNGKGGVFHRKDDYSPLKPIIEQQKGVEDMTTGSKKQHLKFVQKWIVDMKDQAVKDQAGEHRSKYYSGTGTLFDRNAAIRQMSRVMMVLFLLSFLGTGSFQVMAVSATNADSNAAFVHKTTVPAETIVAQRPPILTATLMTKMSNALMLEKNRMPKWQLDVFEADGNRNNQDEQPLEFGKWMISTPLGDSSFEDTRVKSTKIYHPLFRLRRWKPEDTLELTEEYTGRRLVLNGRFDQLDVQTEPAHLHLRRDAVITTLYIADHLEDITLTLEEGAEIGERVLYSEEERRMALLKAAEEEQREAAERKEDARRRREERADRDREEESPVLPAPEPETGTDTDTGTETPQPKSHFASGWGTAESPYVISLPEHLKALGDYPDNEPLVEDESEEENEAENGQEGIDDSGIDALGEASTEIEKTSNENDALEAVANYLAAHYVIQLSEGVTTLDMSDLDIPADKPLKPIGSVETPFTGNFDGNGVTIEGLAMNTKNHHAGGLFGVIGEGALVENMILLDVQIVGRGKLGGLAGENQGTISRVQLLRTSGSDIATNVLYKSDDGQVSNVATGGLVGVNESSGKIERSGANLVISSAPEVIGMVAGINKGRIDESYAKGTINLTQNIQGGLVGKLHSGYITNSYSWVSLNNITGINRGGLVGWVSEVKDSTTAHILNSYSESDMSHFYHVKTGPLVGNTFFVVDGTVVSSYHNFPVKVGSANVIGEGLTSLEMSDADSFQGLNFSEANSIWVMADRGDGIFRPRLHWEK